MNNLTEKIRSGDTRALEYIFEKYSGVLVGFVYSYIKDNMRAEDIVQDSFIAFWNNRTQLSPDSNVKSLLYTICRNRALNMLRDEKRQLKGMTLTTIEIADVDSLSSLDFEFTSDADIEGRVAELINGLPEKYREVFVLSRVEDMTYSQISSQLNITTKAVEKRMSKTLSLFRKKFKDDILLFLIAISLFILLGSRVLI